MREIKGLLGGAVAMALQIHPVVQALFALMFLDIVSGLVSAWIRGVISSQVSREGMARKSFILLLVAVGWVLEHKLGAPLDLDVAVAGFYCVTEGLSIIENAKACGISVPGVLIDRFKNEKKEIK